MSFVPVSLDELEVIVSECARDLLEKWAIDGEIPDGEMANYSTLSVDTVAFVIDKFMGYMNQAMENKGGSFK